MQVSTDRVGLKCALRFAYGLGCCLSLELASIALAQQSAYAQDGPQVMVEGSRAARRGGPRGGEGQPTPPVAAQPAEGAKPGQPATGAEKKPGEPGGEKKEEKPTDVQRPEAPPKEADPKELEVVLNDNSQVPPFNFQGQPWPAVLQWYAKLANCSLDWQELPTGYVNVFTQRPYGLDDVRSLLNRYLLARGYVLIQRDRVVSVFKMDNLDPSLVEQVTELDLYSRKPYDVVKVAFQLPKSVDVAKLKDEVKQVLNPKAKLMALLTTKQILAIDAVSNLQTLSQMLNEERAKEDGKSPLKEFVLKYRRAEEVIDILYVTLGLDPKSKPSQMEMQLQQQKLQIMQQMQQRGADVASMLKKDGPPVFLSYNRQKNSVIANAPEEQMAMIEQTLKMLDVPIGGVVPKETATADAATDRTFKTSTFKLKTLNPQSFASTLEEIGGLDPFTVLKADNPAKSIFVQGVAADHKRIQELVDQLDGEERVFKVISLRRYRADEVAVTIRELVAGKKEVKEETSQDSYYRALANMYSSSSSRSGMPKEDPHEGFYVAPDVNRNQLMVKANKLEFELISSLLKQMGEVQLERADGVAMRVLDPTGDDVLERIRKAWGDMGDNPLVIDAQPKKKSTDDGDTKDEAKAKPTSTSPAKDKGVQVDPSNPTPAIFARFGGKSDSDDEATAAVMGSDKAESTTSNTAATPLSAPPKSAEATTTTASQEATATSPPAAPDAAKKDDRPPVAITVTEDGRLVIRSTDLEAIARLEALITELSPPPKRFKKFQLRHTKASNMVLNLNDVFKEELNDEGNQIMDIFGRYQKTGKESGTGLAKRPKLMITWDPPTNSVLVSNATAAQLHEIEQIITEFDQAPPETLSVRTRRNESVKIVYSKASIIAAALKEVYVDLLSSRDKEFDSGEGRRQGSSDTKYLTAIKFGDLENGGDDKPPRLPVSFGGELSIGVDDVSNVLLISCQEEIWEGVLAMVKKLDRESAPQMSIMVHELTGTIKASDLQKTMEDSVGKPWLGSRPEEMQGGRGGGGGGQQPAQAQGGGQPPPNQGRRGGGARGGR